MIEYEMFFTIQCFHKKYSKEQPQGNKVKQKREIRTRMVKVYRRCKKLNALMVSSMLGLKLVKT